MYKIYYTCILLFAVILPSMAQIEITGTITDENGLAIPGANISEKDVSNGTVTDFDGKYAITVNEGATLVYSYVGYVSQFVRVDVSKEINIQLKEGAELEQIVLVGSRSPKRTVTDTPVAVDMIDVKSLTNKTGKVEITELLQLAAPSFNAQKQSGADGADHIVPATLRGLGPDQTLVLINGKRRHQSSLINLFGTRGRGNTGTDLNAIPSTAIKRIEVLRDGAAAQYGSDAIAGVINIVLKNDDDVLSGEVFYGVNDRNETGGFGVPAREGVDGNTTKVTTNFGTKLGDKGGFLNVTGEFFSKEKTLRRGASFRSGFGEAEIESLNGFFNAEIPFGEETVFYAFGGLSHKDTDAFAFDRDADSERNVIAIYPNGFTPRITSIITDNAVSAGIRTTFKGWNVDVSNTFGVNKFHYTIEGTLNATLLDASPTEFDAGGHTLSQNTTGIGLHRQFDVLSGLNIAMGTEYRIENFTIFAGEEGSYTQYDANGIPVNSQTPVADVLTAPNGEIRPAGSQGFPGYSPANEVDESRYNVSAYLDAELDITDSWLIAAAARFENYSDFGNTINGKFSTRVKITPDFNFRGSVSTGFRAPSLAQLHYNLRFSDFTPTGLVETLLSANNSPVTRSFGIGALEEEKSVSASVGFSYANGGFTASLDGYYTRVDDRIVLTDSFGPGDGLDPSLGVGQARFFVNGVDTETLGLDLVIAYSKSYENQSFGISATANVNNLTIDKINNGSLNQATFFGPREVAFLEASAPDYKGTLSIDYSYKKFGVNVVNTFYGEVGPFVNFDDELYEYGFTTATDLSLFYKLTSNLKLTVGSNNLFNEYPDEQDPNQTESAGTYDAVQQGFGGAFYYTRLNYNF